MTNQLYPHNFSKFYLFIILFLLKCVSLLAQNIEVVDNNVNKNAITNLHGYCNTRTFTDQVHLKFNGFNETYVVYKTSNGDFSTGAIPIGKLNTNGETTIGHTDQIGDSSYNLKLSQRRSEQLKTYLVSNGISKRRIVAIGKGEEKLVEKCTSCTKEQNQKNRRVEIDLSDN